MPVRNVLIVFVALGLGALAQTGNRLQLASRTAKDPHWLRNEWFTRQRAYPFERIPSGARAREWRERQAMGAVTGGSWTFVGPQGETTPWTAVSSGRISSLAVDPRNSQVVWAGAADGGVWKTSDGGTHWTPMTDGQPSLSTGSLAIDPTNPDTIYVGTGEANQSGDEYGGVGILKSSDGGATWTNYPGPFTGGPISAIAVSAANSQVVLASAAGGIFRSTDGGATWKNVLPGVLGTSVLFDPATPERAWAGLGYSFGDSANGVYQSLDGGQTWTRNLGSAPNTLPAASQIGRVTIALAPSYPSMVVVGIGGLLSGAPATGVPGVYRTTDGGANWTPAGSPGYSPNWYENTLAISPINKLLMIGGGSSLSVSSNGGAGWATESALIHPDQHAVAFSKDGSVVYVGNDGGVYKTSDPANPDAVWTDLNATLGVAQFYPGFSIHPTDRTIAIGGTQDNGTLKYSGSPTWQWIACGDGGATAIDPVHTATMYVSCVAAGVPPVNKSIDGGVTVLSASQGIDSAEGVPFPPYLAMDPSNPNTLYVTGNQHIYQTTDGAASWHPISPDLSQGIGALSAIAVASSDSDTVYAGTESGLLYFTHNATSGVSATWVESSGIPRRFMKAIAVDPANPNLAYVALSGFGSGHLFMTADGGETWLDISGNLPNAPVNDVATDPDLAETLYVGTDIGVFVSNNLGRSWSPLGTGLPNAVVTGVRLHRASRTLRVSTHGRGMWDLPIPAASSCSYSLNIGGEAFPSGGGGGTISISTGPGCPWTVSSLPAWITLTGPASGVGSGVVQFQIAPNTSGDLSGAFFIAGQMFTVQEAASSIPGLTSAGSLAQVASEGTWVFRLDAVNLATSASEARFTFSDNNGNPLTLPLMFPQLNAAGAPLLASTLDQTLNANAGLVLESSGPASSALVGWGQLLTNGGITGFGTFSNPSLGWNAVVPLETRNAAAYFLAFDNTGTVTTGVAIANIAAQSASVPVIIRDDTGRILGTAALGLTAQGHTSFMLNQQYPATAGRRGTVEFDTPPRGQISVLGLRANGSALTTLPVLANVNPGGGSLAHTTFNGGFTSSFYLVNTGTTPASFTLSFFDENGNPLAVPLTLPQTGGAETTPALSSTLEAGAMLVVQTQAQDALPSVVGSAQLSTAGAISGFEIFRWTTFGQEASVPLETRTPNSFVLVFDDTNGLTTGVALANQANGSAAIPVYLRDANGTIIQTATANLSARGHTSFILPTAYTGAANLRGMAEFVVPLGGKISVIGLRAKSDGTLTTIPALTK